MRKLWVLLLGLILLNSCGTSVAFVRGEYAFGVPFAAAKVRNDHRTGTRSGGIPEGGVPMNGHYIATKAGIKEEVSENIDLGIAAGPFIFIPTRGPTEEYFGVEASPRITYTGWYVQPYLETLAGVGYTGRKWEGEGTRHLFSIGAGIGASIPLNKSLKVNVGYRFYHISNGSKVFGSKGPNVGYNTDLLMIGLQYNF